MPAQRPQRIRLGDFLVEKNLITDEQLQEALNQQKTSGKKLGKIIVDSGFVKEDEIAKALARQLNIKYVDLKAFTPNPNAVKLLPEAAARRFRALVIKQFEGSDELEVALADPTDINAYDELSRILKNDNITFVSVTESGLLSTLDRVYHKTEAISSLSKELRSELGTNDLQNILGFGANVGAEDAPVAKLLQTIFDEAMRLRASDIHFEPQEKFLRIRFRIDGVLHVQTESDSAISNAVALRLKLISGLDISEKRLPQDGRFNITVRGMNIDVRISTLPTQYGESIVMRLLNQSAGMLQLEKMGIPKRVLDRFTYALKRPSGMVLVTGPTGSGKTTTLYAALNMLNDPGKKLITVEDPVEYRLPGLNQVQVHEKIDLSFARVLRTVLRQDPDIVLVGEMRDQETAEIGMRAAMTGHLVLSTLHTNDALSTPIRLLDMGIPRYMVALSLHMVMAQRLVRKICENCKEEYTPNPNEHSWLKHELGDNVDAHKFYHGRGCSLCNNSGYNGRTGVYEFLEMSDELVDAINEGDPIKFMRIGKTQMAGNTLRRDAVNRCLDGITTISEAIRINNLFEEE